ncbi:hypothetical protein [Nocardioides sp.]|uniref:hypothetical protein n=1 Tax=Nocardioides sp. TaxID=35761 RepID=UPI0035B05717
MYDAPLRAQLDCPEEWLEPVTAALLVAGVATDRSAPVGLAVAPGRLVSHTLDDWTVSSLPHLLVGVRPHAVEVGPWVLAGVGPCARCVAAAVLDDGSRSSSRHLQPSLLTMAAGFAARDLAAWSRGETPGTWLTSWQLDHEPLPRERRWERHPYCGCTWFDTA